MHVKRTGLLLCFFLGSCGPASPPAPPRELPSALVFPESVAINVDTVRSGDSSNSTYVGMEGKFSGAITGGADLAYGVNDQVDNFLERLNEMEIPVSTETTKYDESYSSFKIDFSDYDFDNDGVKEGCSGHTAATPICFRIWYNNQRFMAGTFSEFPTEENPGAGQFILVLLNTAGEADSIDDYIFARVIYDHKDPENKSSEFFAEGYFPAEPPDPFLGHFRLTQVGPENSAKKGLNMHMEYEAEHEGEELFNMTRYVGQWKEGDDYWSGSVLLSTNGQVYYNQSNLCVQISTGDQANQGNCANLGIEVTGIDFIDAATDDDVTLPTDFPESPTL